MKIAVYSRKSKFSERGESIKNQIELCVGYAKTNFSCSEDDIVVYEDDGYSGGSVERPEFKRLMRDVADKRYDVLICYRLDRVSRNVLDFSAVLDALAKADAAFVSITERFDTTTPMGRAMISIAAVFAQLERETIAERIRDNLRRLQRTGRYLGSTPPQGFISERIEYTDVNGNKKTMNRLSPVLGEQSFVRLVYAKYLELASLAGTEGWLTRNGRKNKNGNYAGVSELRRLLTNPVYVRADEAVFDYFNAIGADVVNAREEFNGANGMFLYGRHDRSAERCVPGGWTVVIAGHEGLISSEDWLRAQYLLEAKRRSAPRAGTSKTALLASKIRCAGCGAVMVVAYGGDRARHYYKCKTKITSRKALCDVSNITGRIIDEEVFGYLTGLCRDNSLIAEALAKQRSVELANRDFFSMKKAELSLAIRQKECEIRNLTARLRENRDSSASAYIISDIEKIDSEIAVLRGELEQAGGRSGESFANDCFSVFSGFGKLPPVMELEEKKKFIDRIVDRIIWDGSSACIVFR